MKTLREPERSVEGSASAAKKQKTGRDSEDEQQQQRDALLQQKEPTPIQSFSSTEKRVWRGICQEFDFLENQQPDSMLEERVRTLLCDAQIETYPQLTQIHSEETACLLQRVLASNDAHAYFDAVHTPTVALDHCADSFSCQVVKNLIRKNPSALLWPWVKNWAVDPDSDEIMTFDDEPIINIVSKVKPSLMIWLARNYTSILDCEWKSSEGRTEETIGSMVSAEIIRYGSADTISTFLKEFPHLLAPGNKLPIVLLSRLRLSWSSLDIREFESNISTLKWVEETSPQSIVFSLYEILRQLAWAITQHSRYNHDQSSKLLFELARFLLQKYPLSLLRTDECLRLYPLLRYLRRPQPYPYLVKYLYMVLRLLHANGFDIKGMLDAERSSYSFWRPETQQDLEDFHKARNLVDLICQEGQISRELVWLRLAATRLQSAKQHSDAVEAFRVWSQTRSEVAFSSHARVKTIRDQMDQLLFG